MNIWKREGDLVVTRGRWGGVSQSRQTQLSSMSKSGELVGSMRILVKNIVLAGHRWPTPIILATQEAEIRRRVV
jgi:hypothetical protein